jgi:hypothetical protein
MKKHSKLNHPCYTNSFNQNQVFILKYHNSITKYSFIHSNDFLKLNINFKDVSWFTEKVMLKFHEKCSMTNM